MPPWLAYTDTHRQLLTGRSRPAELKKTDENKKSEKRQAARQ